MVEENPAMVPPSRWRTSFEVVSTFVMIGLAATLVWARFFPSPAGRFPVANVPVPKTPVQIDESTSVGAESARVAVIEYADFECGACRQFVKDVEPSLMRDYVDRGRVKFVFKNFPLVMHVRGSVAAAAASCAALQGRFWPMHNWLFAAPPNLDDSNLQQPSAGLGLDMAKYNACRMADQAANQIQAARSEGDALNVAATPTFFFGKILADKHSVQISDTMMGYRSLEAFKTTLDRLLR